MDDVREEIIDEVSKDEFDPEQVFELGKQVLNELDQQEEELKYEETKHEQEEVDKIDTEKMIKQEFKYFVSRIIPKLHSQIQKTSI